jgi:hypothetical protein
MAWRGMNPLRRFDAQDDHSAQPLLTHSDRTASSTGAMPVRPTEPVPPNRVAIVTGLGGGICRYLCGTVGLTRCPRLRKVAGSKLELRWSPEQIAGPLKAGYPGDPEMRVSHETIYLSPFAPVQGGRCVRSWPGTCAAAGPGAGRAGCR